jgi:2-aminoadipate transaminase
MGTGGAGDHPDRDANPQLSQNIHAGKTNCLGGFASIRHTSGMSEPPQTPARRAHTSTRDLERYADLFAERTAVMRSSAMRDLMAITARPEVISLAGGLPDTSTFPPRSFAAQMTRIAQHSAAEALQYGPTEGFEETKDCILQVMGAEGMLPDTDDLIVTTGGQQAIDLVCKTLVDPGDVVICEAPTYPGAVPVFCSYQADVVQIECDRDGMKVEELGPLLDRLRAEGRRPKFVYTVPTFQNPAGVTLSLERRRRLVELARANELLVVEDNPYGLLRFGGEPLPPLYQLDGGDFVIYIGTFSKILSPGIRLGWAVAPPPVMEKIVLGKQAADLCTSTLTQYFVREYFAEGRWQAYIDELVELYRGRRDTMLAALSDHFPAEATWTEPEGGLFIWATLPEYIDTGDLLAKALRHDVAFVPGQAAYVDGRGANSMRLNFSGVTEEEIREGIGRIGKVVAEQVELYETLIGPPGMPGREAEDMPGGSAQSSSGSDRNLTPSESDEDQLAADQGGDVLPFRKAGEAGG